MRRVWSGSAVWGLLAWVYLVFAGSIDAVEITCAVIAASLAVAVAVAMANIDERRFGTSVPIKAILRPVASVLPDFVAVGLVLLTFGRDRPRRGHFVRQPFRSGGADGRAMTRRAATIIGLSLAPRTFVVRGEESDELLLHCLPAKAASPDRAWPA